MRTKTPLDQQKIELIVGFLRAFYSPSLKDGNGIVDLERTLSTHKSLSPREFRKAESIYTRLYAGKKGKHGR